jgi:cytidine deaminase
MTDPHQVHSLIASAISECSKHSSAGAIHAEEAKILTKCVVEQLGDAGFQIVAPTEKSAISVASATADGTSEA